MRRSEINQAIGGAIETLSSAGVALPPQATWDLADWGRRRGDAGEMAARGIGWDLTDFGLGRFSQDGLILYTLSNGIRDPLTGRTLDQTYANKLLVIGQGQVTHAHHHRFKMEDIIVLAGGNLRIRLHNVGPDESLDETSPVRILRNNLWETVAAGTIITLVPGERVRLDQNHYHRFWGEEGLGTVVVEEVSMVNDDRTDNYFSPEQEVGRDLAIFDDEEPRYLLCTELPGTEAFAALALKYLRDGPGEASP